MWQSVGALLEEEDLILTNEWLLSKSTRSKRQMKIDLYQTQRKRRLRMPKEKYLSMKKKKKKTWPVGQPDQIFIYYIKVEVQLEFKSNSN